MIDTSDYLTGVWLHGTICFLHYHIFEQSEKVITKDMVNKIVSLVEEKVSNL